MTQEIEKDYAQQAEFLKALAHSTRLRIAEGLIETAGGELSVMDIVESLDLPQATISQHLKILKSAGIIEGERQGTKIIYRIKSDRAKDIADILFRKY